MYSASLRPIAAAVFGRLLMPETMPLNGVEQKMRVELMAQVM